MALRRLDGFRRYAFAVQYHGAPFLGFTFQGDQEDCVVRWENGKTTDLRGWTSVEGRIRKALTNLVGQDNFENIQVSSRTDRGVHAVRNTCHVDIRPRRYHSDTQQWDPLDLHRGLNYHLHRTIPQERRRQKDSSWILQGRNQELCVLSVADAPRLMKNKFYAQGDRDQPPTIDWNARFSATQRTYVYRITNMVGDERDYGVPFEWDRSWRICSQKTPLDVSAMKEATLYLTGTHDFTSFKSSRCQRLSPIVTVQDIQISSQPYGDAFFWSDKHTNVGSGGLLGLGTTKPSSASSSGTVNLVTLTIVGESFLYRQVRNMVGCLVKVGMGLLTPRDVEMLLNQRDRSKAPAMAPAHGLFLVNVKHGDFVF